jgi:GT2 family glycosyltransferase
LSRDRLQASIVIVNYQSGPYLARCLSSLAAGCAGFAWDAVVVDNGSLDGSERAADGRAGNVRLTRIERNLGFAAAANIGVRATTAPYVLLLNPDAQLTPGCLAPLVDDLERHPDCAVVAPLVVNEDDTPQGKRPRRSHDDDGSVRPNEPDAATGSTIPRGYTQRRSCRRLRRLQFRG